MKGIFKMKKISSGKVREIYEVDDDKLLLVVSDRISAFDYILPAMIPNKGKVLNQISKFWFDYVADIIPNHVISVDSDWLYPTEQGTELVTALNANNLEVSFSEIKSNYGHDAFLLEKGQLNFILSKFLSENIASDLMTEEVATIKENADVRDAAKLMLDRHVTHIPVVTDDYKLIGIVTSWDLSKSIATDSIHLSDIMTTTVKYCNPSDTIEEIARMMRKFDISCLPVVDENMKVLGLITTDQISNLLS